EETPSHTTSAANARSSSADGLAASAIASSLRECRTPRSHTPATHAAGRSAQWSRSDAAGSPHSVQYPSSATVPPHRTHGRAAGAAGPDGTDPGAASPVTVPGSSVVVPGSGASGDAGPPEDTGLPDDAGEPVGAGSPPAGGSGASGVPHASQNRAPSCAGSPHAGHASADDSATVSPGAVEEESLIGPYTAAPRSRGRRARSARRASR